MNNNILLFLVNRDCRKPNGFSLTSGSGSIGMSSFVFFDNALISDSLCYYSIENINLNIGSLSMNIFEILINGCGYEDHLHSLQEHRFNNVLILVFKRLQMERLIM